MKGIKLLGIILTSLCLLFVFGCKKRKAELLIEVRYGINNNGAYVYQLEFEDDFLYEYYDKNNKLIKLGYETEFFKYDNIEYKNVPLKFYKLENLYYQDSNLKYHYTNDEINIYEIKTEINVPGTNMSVFDYKYFVYYKDIKEYID